MAKAVSAKKAAGKEKSAFARRLNNSPVNYGPLPDGHFCAICRKVGASLLRCSCCKVVSYCGKEHQAEHRPLHRSLCDAVARELPIVAAKEERLRCFPGDDELPPGNLCEHFAGYFWSFAPAAEYTRARMTVAGIYGEIDPPTRAAVEAQLHHNLAVVKLCHSDDMMFSELAPSMMMRLGKDQDCFDFLKWWKTTGYETPPPWDEDPSRFLDIHGADPFEPMSYRFPKESHFALLVSMVLLRIRVLLDLRRVLAASNALRSRLPPEIVSDVRKYVPWTSIVADDRTFTHGEPDEWIGRLDQVKNEVDALYAAVTQKNAHFFPRLLKPGNIFAIQPRKWKDGSVEHAAVAMMCTYRAWIETPGAIEFVRKRVDEGRLNG